MVIVLISSTTAVYAISLENGSTNNGSTIYVSVKGNDSNNGLTELTSKRTIQNAINTANTDAEIVIATGTYKENLNITKNIKLTGIKNKKVIIDGQGNGACIFIPKDITVNIQGLTITKGSMGGIDNLGNLTLKDSTITKNKAKWGGGICNKGVLTVNNCTIKENKAAWGGGVGSAGVLTVINCIISENNADDGGGLAVTGENVGENLIEHSTIKDNEAKEKGGGIYVTLQGEGSFFMRQCNVEGNIADNGGGIFSDATFDHHHQPHVRAHVNNSTIQYNRASIGGGVTNWAYITFDNTIIKCNTAYLAGGGIANPAISGEAWLFLRNCEVTRNWSGLGGGIDNDDNILRQGHVFSKNSKIHGNWIVNISGLSDEPLQWESEIYP